MGERTARAIRSKTRKTPPLHPAKVTARRTGKGEPAAAAAERAPDEKLAAFTANLGTEIARRDFRNGGREVAFQSGAHFYLASEMVRLQHEGQWVDVDSLQDELPETDVRAMTLTLPPAQVRYVYDFEPILSGDLEEWCAHHEIPVPAELAGARDRAGRPAKPAARAQRTAEGEPECLAGFTATLGKEIAFWETATGETQFLFKRGEDYHLVTESIRGRSPSDGFAFNARVLTREEILRWFWDTIITGMIPAEFREVFSPIERAAPGTPPSTQRHRDLEGEISATCALLELLAQTIATPDTEETGAFRGRLGDGRLTLATRQGQRLQSALLKATK